MFTYIYYIVWNPVLPVKVTEYSNLNTDPVNQLKY